MKTEEITIVPYEEAIRELEKRVAKAGGITALASQTGVHNTLLHMALKGSAKAGPKVLKILDLEPVRVLQKIKSQGK